MGLESSDILLVERGGTLYRETFGNRANIDSTDLLLVEATSTTGGRTAGEIYKCTWSDFDTSATPELTTYNTNTDETLSLSTTSSSGDSADDYNVFSKTLAVTGSSVTGHFYFGIRLNGSTNYFHDFAFAGIQILQSSGSSYRSDSTYTSGYDWNFENTGTYGIQDWRSTSAYSSSSTDPSTLTYSTIATSAVNAKWNRATSTSSNYTGPADGIYSGLAGYSGGGGAIIPASGTISQQSNTYFLYLETSSVGHTAGTSTGWLKSPEVTVYNNDILRFAYLGVGGNTSTNGLGTRNDETLWIRFK